MSTLSGFILQRLGVTVFPDVLKRRSDGEDVAQAHKYFLASLASSFSSPKYSQTGALVFGFGTSSDAIVLRFFFREHVHLYRKIPFCKPIFSILL